mmetsp:Transcript_136/g.177  ORF Transcript_136/g.177 Transcript_136/m.177 type:complete len:204 (+) Transcript_136:31-642(+)
MVFSGLIDSLVSHLNDVAFPCWRWRCSRKYTLETSESITNEPDPLKAPPIRNSLKVTNPSSNPRHSALPHSTAQVIKLALQLTFVQWNIRSWNILRLTPRSNRRNFHIQHRGRRQGYQIIVPGQQLPRIRLDRPHTDKLVGIIITIQFGQRRPFLFHRDGYNVHTLGKRRLIIRPCQQSTQNFECCFRPPGRSFHHGFFGRYR